MTLVREIQAKGILNPVKQPDTWFGLRYNMNLYRGCQHQCIYCDSRSECYQIEDFNNEVLVKSNAIELLAQELPRKRIKGTIGTGSMNDPYMPLEADYRLTGRALELIARYRFPVHILTKSDRVLRDRDVIAEINRVYAAVSFTITTADDELAKKLEPCAPLPSARLHAMRVLAECGVQTGVLLMPVLPFIEDNEENIHSIVERAHENGAGYILPAFGMTLRDRQKDYYFARLNEHFPGLSEKYRRTFGGQYSCQVPQALFLRHIFEQLCMRYGIATQMPVYAGQTGETEQLSLL